MTTVIKGDPLILTINVITPNAVFVATGVVVLKDGLSVIATRPVGPSGTVVFDIPSSNLGFGTHTFVAHYAGDANFAPSQSPPITKVIV